MLIKKWEVSPLNKDRAAQLAERWSIPFLLAVILETRGFRTDGQLSSVLAEGSLSDPFLMKDMDKAAERIRRAVDNGEKIAVYGDYDVDGVTATSILYTYLETLGADVMYYIPRRIEEGYGMSCSAVEKLHELGVELIVTVDNGISAVEEIRLARELGMDVVVTDHHRPHQILPDALAVVDAYREDDLCEFKDLSGAGVALKLVIALEDGDAGAVLQEYADLAALGTVADVVSLTGENRLIVREGMKLMAQGDRPGLSSLLERCFSNRELTAQNLAFTVLPRINAAGRMGTADRAVHLLCCEDPEEADSLAEEICRDNDERRKIETEILEEAVREVESDPSLAYDRVLIVTGKDWHHGVVGLIAGKISERFGKPCFAVSVDGETAKGSGRSVEGFSLFDALTACSDVLTGFGGHPMAAGINLRSCDVELFRKRINEYAAREYPLMPAPVLKLDCRLNPDNISPELVRDLRRLEPCGEGNPPPMFGLFGMTLREVIPVGSEGNHLRLVCEKNGVTRTCMKFFTRREEFPFRAGDIVDLAVKLDVQEYRGRDELSIKVTELRPSGGDGEAWLRSFRIYEAFRRGEPMAGMSRELTPSREDLASVYRRVRDQGNLPVLAQSLAACLPGGSLGKLMVCLDMLADQKLIAVREQNGALYLEIIPAEGKTDIFASETYAALKQLTSGEEGTA